MTELTPDSNYSFHNDYVHKLQRENRQRKDCIAKLEAEKAGLAYDLLELGSYYTAMETSLLYDKSQLEAEVRRQYAIGLQIAGAVRIGAYDELPEYIDKFFTQPHECV